MTDTVAVLQNVVVALNNLSSVVIANGLNFGTPVQGDIIYRNATAWAYLSPGTAGQVLTTEGIAANPIWADLIPNFTSPTAFWTDDNPLGLPEPPRQLNFNGRVYFGQAAGAFPNRAAPPHTGAGWLVSGAVGANWIPRDSDVTCVSAVGGIAISGISRTSDGSISATSIAPPSIGVAGYSVNDLIGAPLGQGVWGMYAEAARGTGGVTGGSIGIEIDNRNCGTNVTLNPYSFFPSGLTAGAWINAMDANINYGVTPINPCTVAIGLLSGVGFGWNTGIAFQSTSIAGTDGVTGTGVAIDMARGHIIRWTQPTAIAGAQIYSTTDAGSGNMMQLIFGNRAASITNANTVAVLECDSVQSGANGIKILQAINGSTPEIQSIGQTDANVDIFISPKGSGVLRFGTVSALGGRTVTGFITIKDESGATARLAVVT